ncbi:MAG: sensor histidine kinase [Lishizhenia sp.]
MKKSTLKKLFRLSLITSPLIGAVNIAPLKIVADTGEFQEIKNVNIFFGVLVLSAGIFALWQINIFITQVLIKKQQPNTKVLAPIFSFLIVFIFFALLYNFRDGNSPLVSTGLHLFPLFSLLISNTFIVIFIQFILQKEENTDIKLEKAQLEIINLQSRHEKLKQQLNPHFLFNSLSNLRSLIQVNDQRALEYSDDLTSFLRKSIEYNKENLALIKTELAFAENYLSLQRTRFKDSLQYEVSISDDIKNKTYVPIFTLQTLIENAIKHNGFTKKKPLKIKVEYDNTVHSIFVTNNKIVKFDNHPSTKIGLSNLKERFELEKRKVPIITETQTEFKIEIPLK